MSGLPDDPQAFVHAWLDAFNRRDWTAYAEFFAEDVTYLTPGMSQPLVSRTSHVDQDRTNAGSGRLDPTLIMPSQDGQHIAVEGVFRDGTRASAWVSILTLRGGRIAAERLYFDRTPA